MIFHFKALSRYKKGFSEWNLCPRFSHKSCQFDCGLEKALSTSHCVPWCSSFHENIVISLRYLPHREDAYRKTCRSYKSDLPFVFSSVYHYLMYWLHSASETREFLKVMANVSELDCNCLPDCDLTKFHFTHSTTDLMWVLRESSSNCLWTRTMNIVPVIKQLSLVYRIYLFRSMII